jgi:hypothetical protein
MPLPPIKTVPRTDEIPLSYFQEIIYERLVRGGFGNSSYNLFRVLELVGALDIAALERTLNEIIRRHEILRMTLHDEDGRWVQKVAAERSLRLHVNDLSGVPEELREARVRELVAEDVRRVFDLTSDLMLRATLFRLGEARHVLSLTTHHLAADGWAMRILLREVSELYKAFSRGRPSPLPEPPVQYADYTIWQREWTRGEYLEELFDYSRQHLVGAFPVTFPPDRPRPESLTLRGAHQPFAFGPELTEALRAFSRREGGTLFMTLLAGFKLLLYKYTGCDDLAILTPAANRSRREVEGLIGFFSNYLLLRTKFSGDTTLGEFYEQVRDVTLGAYEQQELPLPIVMRRLNITLPSVMFSFHAAPRHRPRGDGDAPAARAALLKLMDFDPHETTNRGTTKRDLTLMLFEGVDEIRCLAEYSTDLYLSATINRILADYRRLLEKIVDGGEQRLSTLVG